jgi:hypothetical protein
MPSPFDDVSFDPTAPDEGDQIDYTPSVNADDLSSIYIALANPQKSPFLPSGVPANRTPQQVEGGTTQGVDRVNQDTGNTGAVAYKDSNGRAVLTNVARDPLTGQDKKLPVIPQQAGSKGDTGTKEIGAPDAPLPIFEAMAKLRRTQDINEARALYENLQQSVVQEKTRLETEAAKFAEQKLKVPLLEQQLTQARAADQADPNWYPGIGDSPITKGIVSELAAARSGAKQQMDLYLNQNTSYRNIAVTESNMTAEFKRVESIDVKNQTRVLQAQLSRDTADINRKANAAMRDDERQARFKDDMLQKYEQLTPEQIARIQLLDAADFDGIQSIADESLRKIKVASLALGAGKNKNKDYQSAINAEGNQQLLGLALQGNSYAKKIVIANESTATGQDNASVEAKITALQKAVADPEMVKEVLRNRFAGDPKKQKELEKEFLMNAKSFDPAKKQEVNQQRLSMAYEWMQNRTTQQFVTDVGSWGSSDPMLKAAVDKSKKISGKADLDNVITAYLGDSSGPEYLQKLRDFRNLAQINLAARKDSVFGMPDEAAVKATINRHAISNSRIGQWLQETGRAFSKMADDKTSAGPLAITGPAPYAIYRAGKSVIDNVAENYNVFKAPADFQNQ